MVKSVFDWQDVSRRVVSSRVFIWYFINWSVAEVVVATISADISGVNSWFNYFSSTGAANIIHD